MATASFPIIDAAPLLEPEAFSTRAGREQVAALHAACTGPGFFYVVNHGVTPAEERELFRLAQRFFALPLEAKLRIENLHSPQFRGYTRVGQERTAGSADRREQLDVGREHPALPLRDGDPLFLRLRGPNLWPRELPELGPAVTRWAEALDRVAIAITRGLAVALGQAPDYFDGAFLPAPDSHVKVIRYPRREAPGDPGADQGVGPHKDYGFLAFVLQDESGGLQVDDGAGGYREAAPLPGTLVANIGEMFEVATRGYFRATVHRVQSPPARRERVSLAHFFCPRLEAVLGDVPLPAALAARHTAPPPDPQNPIYAEFGRNALRGWVRSHPAVARRHYPELELA